MSVRRLIPLAAGSLLLLAVMVAGTVSVAMDLAEEKPPPAGPLAAQLQTIEQLQRLPRPAEMIGSIRWVSGSAVSLSTSDGPHTFAVDGDTRVILADGKPGERRDLKRGMDVAVVGEWRDGGRWLRAEVIAVLPPRK